jgi:transposase
MRNRRTISLDLRERILEAYDEGGATRDQVANRFRVSLGMVKKLLQQRRHSGDISNRHHLAGRKPLVLAGHRLEMERLLKAKPDMTLKELREETGLKCSLQAIHVALAKMEMTLKKRLSAPANKTAPTSSRRAKDGKNGRTAWIRRGWSSSTNRVPKRI